MGASNSRDIETTTIGGVENVIIKCAVASMEGFGGKTEDAYAVVPDLDHTTSFFGLYDGHGGAEVAALCARQFHAELQVHPEYQSNLNNALRSVFFRMDELLQQSNEWRELVHDSSNWLRLITTTCLFVNPWYCKEEIPYIPPQSTGSTVCVAVARGNQVIVGNVGDSHCVASRNGQAIQLSTDHKPIHQDEKQRIERAGGNIGVDNFVIEAGRVVGYNVSRGMLVTSRAIGDFGFKQNKNLPTEDQMVICNPDICAMEITNDVQFLVIASRALWFRAAYGREIEPLTDKTQWPQVELPFIVGAPLPKGEVGRRRKLRIKGCLEGGHKKKGVRSTEGDNDSADVRGENATALVNAKGKKYKRGPMTCKRCGQLGHRQASSKCPLNGTAKKRKRRQPRKNVTKVAQKELSSPQRPTREEILRNSPGRVTRSRLAFLLGEGTSSQTNTNSNTPIRMPTVTAPKKMTPKRKLNIG